MDKLVARNIIMKSGCFMADWYLANYPEVAEQDVDPLEDYLEGGAEAGRNPNPYFDSHYYLKQNADLPANINPLIHYCVEGWKEFRRPASCFSGWWYKINFMHGEEGDPLAHYLRCGIERGFSPLPPGKTLDVKSKARFNRNSIGFFDTLPQSAELAARISLELLDLYQYDLADMFARIACERKPDSPHLMVMRAKILVHRNGWLQIRSLLKSATQLEAGCAEWFKMLGDACRKMEDFDESIVAYEKVLELNGESAEVHYQLALSLEAVDDSSKAERHYAWLLENSDKDVQRFGVGLLHQREQDWARAVAAYRSQLASEADDPALLEKLAIVLDKSFNWVEAAAIYEQLLRFGLARHAYPYANVLERLGRYGDAIPYYELALTENPACDDARYRLAFSEFKCGRYERACHHWLKSRVEPLEGSVLEAAWTDADASEYVALAVGFISGNEPEKAAVAYRQACMRSSMHNANLYFEAGRHFAELGDYKSACEMLLGIRVYKSAFLESSALDVNDKKAVYCEHINTLAVSENIIMYESAHGRRVGDNPYYIFEHLLQAPKFSNYYHVWVVRNEEAIPERWQGNEKVLFVQHGSYGYLKYLAVAHYLVNSHTFMPYFLRREGQEYLMTWHGTPMKCMGVDVPSEELDGKNVSRNLLHATHVIFPNQYTLDVMMDCFQVRDICSAKCQVTGSPRVDTLWSQSNDRLTKLREQVGIDDALPIVLYAPTFRGAVSSVSLDLERLRQDLAAMASEQYHLVYSGHQFYDGLDLGLKGVTILGGVDTTAFLAIVDVLVTDYSSVLFDYLPLSRPVLLYPYDYGEYRNQRGLYIDLEDLGPDLYFDAPSVGDALRAGFSSGHWESYATSQTLNKYCPYDDGRALERACDFFLRDQSVETPAVARRKKLLFYMGSFIPNGITSSFLSLVGLIDKAEYDLTLSIDPWTMESYPQRMEKLAVMDKSVKILGRVSFPVASVDEMAMDAFFQKERGRVSEYLISRLRAMYRREYRRLYGDTEFDVVIDFCGYSYFWTALFALGRPSRTRSVLWLHNDMFAEVRSRFPHLVAALSLAPEYDRLASVSGPVCELNKLSLAGGFNISDNSFFVVRNTVDTALIKRRSESECSVSFDFSAWSSGYRVIGVVARLSWEKGIDRLIHAFARLREKLTDIKLIVLGYGPEKEALLELVNKLKLRDWVALPGYFENPYPIMRELDLFVLPSRYEGQGIVLLEAMALGVPVLSTNIPGPDEVVGKGSPLLVESSVDGIYHGLFDYFEGRLYAEKHDLSYYSEQAMSEFKRVIDFN